MLITIATFAHVFICLLLVILVLLQQGKGADTGAVFGGGGNTLFGATGADNLLTRITTFLAVAFMATSLFLAIRGKAAFSVDSDIFSDLPAQIETSADENKTGEAKDAAKEGEQATDAAATTENAVNSTTENTTGEASAEQDKVTNTAESAATTNSVESENAEKSAADIAVSTEAGIEVAPSAADTNAAAK